MRLLAFVPIAFVVTLAGCDEGDPIDARTQDEREIAEQPGQGEGPATSAAKTTREVARERAERAGLDDPTTFIVEEPADLLFGSALDKKNEEETGKEE